MAAGNEPPTVTAGGEVLEGQWLAPGEAVFRGIPFAAAPVADRRWRPPAPHRPRSGRQSAREFAPACVQTERLYDWERSIATAFGNADKFAPPPLRTSEDCLYLNVWTASLGARAAGAGDGLDPRRVERQRRGCVPLDRGERARPRRARSW